MDGDLLPREQVGQADLPEDVKAKLDELANKLKADPAGNFIELTNVGPV